MPTSYDPEISPITLQSVPAESLTHSYGRIYKHSLSDGFADFVATAPFWRGLFAPHGTSDSFNLSDDETRSTFFLVRSHLWRVHHAMKEPFLVCTEDEVQRREIIVEGHPEMAWYEFIPFERFAQEAKELGFERKCQETLINFAHLFKERNSQPYPLPYATITVQTIPKDRPTPFTFSPDRPGVKEDGMAYGCDEHEAVHVYDSLQEQRWVEAPMTANPIPDGAVLTAKGRAELDQLKKRREFVPTAFLIRAFNTDRDAFWDLVSQSVYDRIGVRVDPIWKEKHNDRIDQRILAEIDRCQVVVLDICQRFNVGYEGGYAEKGGKEIVMVYEEHEVLPLDVTTRNATKYALSEPEKLAEEIAARIDFARKKLSSV